MLNTKSGQLVELANLASYLGSSVHISACVKVLQQDPNGDLIGDGFAKGKREEVRNYESTVPRLCTSIGSNFIDIDNYTPVSFFCVPGFRSTWKSNVFLQTQAQGGRAHPALGVWSHY